MQFGQFSVAQYVAQFRWLHEQYVTHHLRVELKGCAFRTPAGEILGYLEEIWLSGNRLMLRGWAQVDSATFRLGPIARQVQPRSERLDVSTARACDPFVGFTTSLPFSKAPLEIELVKDGGPPFVITHYMDVDQGRARAVRSLQWQFWRELLPLILTIAKGLRRSDPDIRRLIKTSLRLDQGRSIPVLDKRFLAAAGVVHPSVCDTLSAVTIILPVFNAFHLLPEVLARIEVNTDLPWHLIVIEDRSTDGEVRPWLHGWVSRQPEGRVTLLENEMNQGFIRSINRGFETVSSMARTGPVIIINSDAMVPMDWASRLTAPLLDPSVASVTPLSNDAEIFSAPVICKGAELKPGQGDHIDTVLRQKIAGSDAPQVAVPTGVGFCMAIGSGWITRVGTFDTGFGRGYGEEVDWCRRAAALGGQHVAATNLFVEHRGGASFGAEKIALVQQNNAIISNLYPGYDRSVQEFMRDDPLATPRLIAALAWLDSLPETEEIPVYIAHSMGGGADNYLKAQQSEKSATVVLRLGGAERCQIELETAIGRFVTSSDDLGLVVRFIASISKRRIIYSNAVGDHDLRDVPAFLIALSDGAELEILFHDYLPISPSYTLLDKDGVFRGVPGPKTTDAAHLYQCPDGTHLGLSDWRSLWAKALHQACRVVAFSESSARIIAQAYPDIARRISVQPHQILQPPSVLAPGSGVGKVVGVLGAIGLQKGATIVSALSLMLERRHDIKLVLIGYIAPGFPLGQRTEIHGRYDTKDIATLAKHYGITHWLIPSIWPETFSYTVHECLATGLPTLAFNLGAHGDAVKQASNGIVLCLPHDKLDAKAYGQLIVTGVDGS